jgi:2-acylglycerol O-acyltransferase 2
MSLNPEPSQPEERAEHDLAPKSYAEAAEEALDQPSPAHEDESESRLGPAFEPLEPSKPNERAAHHLPPKSYAAAAEEALEHESHDRLTDGAHEPIPKPDTLISNTKGNGHVHTRTAEEVEQYEGAGTDDTPKSPPRGHRRKTSLKSNGSIGRKHGEVFNHNNRNDYDLYESYEESNGNALMSVKPQPDDEKERSNKPKTRRNSELKSGRQAGEGWHKSKYV